MHGNKEDWPEGMGEGGKGRKKEKDIFKEQV